MDSDTLRLHVDLTSVNPSSGGVGTVASEIVRGFVVNGERVTCLVSSNAAPEWGDTLGDLSGVQISPLQISLPADGRVQSFLRRRMPANLRRSRVVGWVRLARSRSVPKLAGAPVTWMPFHRVPPTQQRFVVTVHDLRVFEEGLESKMDQRILRSNIENSEAVICSWPHPYQRVLEMFPDAAHKTFLSALPVLKPGSPTQRTLPADGSVRVLLPAFVTPHKNHEVLVRALAQSPRLQLIFTGTEDAAHAEWLRSLSDELGVASRIDWRGFVSDAELENAYADATILAMPTRWEAASGPIFEAITRTLPFVASDIGPIRSQLEMLGLDAPTFDPDDVNALIAGIDEIVADYPAAVRALEVHADALLQRTWNDTAREYAQVIAWAEGRGSIPSALRPGVAA